MMPESAYVSSLLQLDIESFRSFVCTRIEDIYDKLEPGKSLNKKAILDLICDVHNGLDILRRQIYGQDTEC